MKKVINIKIEIASKNIIVEYFDEETQQSIIRGFSPNIASDWDDIGLEQDLLPYRKTAWDGIVKP